MLVGPGAGQMPTASAVVGDLINLASALRLPDFAPYFHPAIEAGEAPLCPVEDGASAFYIRLETEDSPGVIGNIGHALGAQVSAQLASARVASQGPATIILLTHKTSERNLSARSRRSKRRLRPSGRLFCACLKRQFSHGVGSWLGFMVRVQVRGSVSDRLSSAVREIGQKPETQE